MNIKNGQKQMRSSPDGSDRVSAKSDSERFLSVKIRYFGSIRAAAGIEGEELCVQEGTTLAGLLRNISFSHSLELKNEIINKDDTIRQDLMLTLNGVILNIDEIDERILKVEDIISLFPIFPGGG